MSKYDKYNPTISINYQEGNIDTYESVEVTYNFNKDNRVFDSGDFVKDWYDATKFRVLIDGHEVLKFVKSSTVANFISDGAPFDKVVLMYVNTLNGKFEYLSSGIHIGRPTFFIRKDTTPTWKELRELCGDVEELV